MLIETIEYRGHKIQVHSDDDTESPRTAWDNFGHMVCFHKRYDLGDKTNLRSSQFEGWDEMEAYLREKKGAVVIAPLYLYDHSGITMSVKPFSCRWDSGQVGFIYTTRDEILKEHSRKHLSKKLTDQVEQYLIGEVETYDKYLTGEVRGYVVEGPNCDDSCWGFYDEKHMIEEAKQAIDWSIKQLELPGVVG